MTSLEKSTFDPPPPSLLVTFANPAPPMSLSVTLSISNVLSLVLLIYFGSGTYGVPVLLWFLLFFFRHYGGAAYSIVIFDIF